MSDCLCTKEDSVHFSATADLSVNLGLNSIIKTDLNIESSLEIDNKKTLNNLTSLEVEATIDAPIKLTMANSVDFKAKACLDERFIQNHVFKETITANSALKSSLDKFGLGFKEIKGYDKLIPVDDIEAENVYAQDFSSIDNNFLYSYIDEGVFSCNYHETGDQSLNFFEDNRYIRGSGDSLASSYKCRISNPCVSFRDSVFLIRAGANISAQSIYDIEFRDPSGNLICKYEDINFTGDNQFSTYLSKPEINNGSKYTWDREYPIIRSDGCITDQAIEQRDDEDVEARNTQFIFLRDFGSDAEYTLSFKASGNCLDNYDSFNAGFNRGFEFCSPEFDPGIRISALEIANSGDFGYRNEHFVNFYAEVQPTGKRIERCFEPVRVLSPDFDTDVWPSIESVWENQIQTFTNETVEGQTVLAQEISKPYDFSNITLRNTTIADSGKLHLEFSNKSDMVFAFRDGSFAVSFDQREFSIGVGSFQPGDTSWITIDEVSLKVRAKKASGSRDYTIDVVGWSDDGLLNITSDVNGFLQNQTGSGSVPLDSGFLEANYPLGTAPISDQDAYYNQSLLSGSGGDHYLMSPIVVTGETFQDYTIPLKVYNEEVEIGEGKEFNQSSYFEKLFVDIYSIPSGASISNIELCVTHKPSNAFNLSVLGGELGRLQDGRSEGILFPTNTQNNDKFTNLGSSGNYSLIENIPHGYSSPDTLKTNYSRRWRALEGLVSGPFDPNEFGFAFENQQLDSPFIDGFFDFNYFDGNTLYSKPLVNMPVSSVETSGVTTTKNVGFRFKDPTFNTIRSYESIDSNGNVVDAYDNVVVLENPITLTFPRDAAFSIYCRLTDRGEVVSFGKNIFSNTNEIFLALQKLGNSYIVTLVVDDTLGFRQTAISLGETSFPISVIATYKENNDDALRLYVKSENSNEVLKASIPGPFFGTVDSLEIGESGVYLHEFGVSSGTVDNGANLLDQDLYTPDLLHKQQSVQSFLLGHSNHWYDSGNPTIDSGVLPSYIDESTEEWDLGEFSCDFTLHEFDTNEVRVGRDVINFFLKDNAVPYSLKTDNPIPSSIEDVAYHTQIENDFLRFNLTDASDNFYSVHPRLSKDLPCGYNYAENALVVDTIIDYRESGSIVWPDGESGVKFIVSLYTPNKDPQDYEAENYGLINRKVHYLKPVGCFLKLESKFDSQSFFDESEKWSLFPEETRISEFNHKYYSDDIDQMFLQYDLVVPSGGDYEVDLNVHSANVRLEDAYVTPTELNNNLNLVIDDVEQTQYGILNNHLFAVGVSSGDLNLHTDSFAIPVESGSMNLHSSGTFMSLDNLNLFTTNFKEISESGLSLYSSGTFKLEEQLNLLAYNDQLAVPYDRFLTLYSYATPPGTSGVFSKVNLVSYSSLEPSNKASVTNQLDMITLASPGFVDYYAQQELNLHISGPVTFGDSLNLTLFGGDNDGLETTQSLRLHSVAYPKVFLNGSGSPFVEWNSSNQGRGVQEQDEFRFKVPSTDEIRDVQTMCWGDCTNASGECRERELITHNISWVDTSCVDGGVVRPSAPYFNSGVFAFGDSDNGVYEGHFHGLRKYTGLFPNTPYFVTVEGKTGSTDAFEVPRIFEEWEYGSTDTVNYSGVKLLNPDGEFTQDKYGLSLASEKDLLAVSAPNHNLGSYQDAGAIYTYRRGSGIPGEKSAWEFEDKVILPSSYISDWFFEVPGSVSFPGIGTIVERQWQVGQEGRELGYSLDVSNNGDREIMVAGGPGAKWTTRSFEDITMSGVNVGIVVFNNEFDYTRSQINDVLERLKTNNFLYKYFADPPVEVNIKILAVVPTGIFDDDITIDSDVADVLTVKKIPRQIPGRYSESVNQEILSGIKDGFLEAFPFNGGEVNNGIPPIVGFYVDNSRSLGRDKVEPAVDQFVDFYEDYSFNSGVRDFFNVQASGYIYEYTPTSEDEGEEWFEITNNLIDELLDTGRLVETGNDTLITSGVGLEFANEDASVFNNPPDSGGRVYVFERESDEWNLIQMIGSPSQIDRQASTRFGHSVSISDSGNVVAVGSPYLEDSCNIYEYNQNERGRLYDNIGPWLETVSGSGETTKYSLLLNEYKELIRNMGPRDAGRYLYLNEFDRDDRFACRIDFNYWGENPIEEYQLNFTYGLSDLRSNIDGTFKQIALSGAPNPRLGFSSAVNEDGTTVAFGSPTDSLGVYDNSDFYFLHSEGFYTDSEHGNDFYDSAPIGAWPSNLNAGAVRVFTKGKNVLPTNESGIFYEYNRFGNLSNTLNNTESFDEFGNEVNSTNISQLENYRKTDFTQTSIPKDSPAIFIITPEIDATNDEVIQEIKDYLAQGDRKLVLVGDDPIWEKDGAYAKSNEIINTILEKLGSRMRLHPAKDEREALVVNNVCSGSLVENVVKSYIPHGSNNTTIDTANNLHSFGVADIRLHIPDVVFGPRTWGEGHVVVDNKLYGKCSAFNKKCGPPIAHKGDLRAKWTERERRDPFDNKEPFAYWERNVPFEYFSTSLPQVSPEDALDIATELAIVAPKEQPRPIMVAAEYSENFRDIPEQPEITELRPITETVVRESNSTVVEYEFGDNHVEEVAFIWSEESGVFNLVDTNIRDNESPGVFYNPSEFNGRDGLLQASGLLEIELEEFTDYIEVDDELNVCSKQDIFGSEVYLIATVESESQDSLSFENDENISFYDNLVRKENCDSASIVQLGGWTGTNTFKDGYSESLLKEVFEFMGHSVVEGWSSPTLPSTRDVMWISNTSNFATDDQANAIRSWLSQAGKKLVITYDGDEDKAAAAYSLCNKLGLGIRPWFLPAAQSHPVYRENRFYYPNIVRVENLILNNADQAVSSCNGNTPVTFFQHNNSFVPIERAVGTRVLYYDAILNDEQLAINTNNIWRMNTGVSQVQFPAIPGSGYRIFYNWFSDSPGEEQPLDLYFGDVRWKRSVDTKAENPETVGSDGSITIYDYDASDELIIAEKATFKKTISSSIGSTRGDFVDIQVPHDKNYINFFVTGNRAEVNSNGTDVPRTSRFLSVSGCPLPIDRTERIVVDTETDTITVGFEEVVVQEFRPAERVFLAPILRAIQNDNTRYCLEAGFDETCGGQLVSDGPVIVAEEPENFSDFVFGNERSKIVLISDSTLVNGCLTNDGGTTSEDGLLSGTPLVEQGNVLGRTRQFINSLLENTSSSTSQSGYTFTQKVVSPERGSPFIYNRTSRFGNQTGFSASSFVDESDYNEQSITASLYSENEFEDALERVVNEFESDVSSFGSSLLVYNSGTNYYDSRLQDAPISNFMRLTGKDLIDRDVLSSGYPGDLFGYSLDIHNNQLIVGSPYSAWNTSGISNYNVVSSLFSVLNVLYENNNILSIAYGEVQDQQQINEAVSGSLALTQDGGGGSVYTFSPTVDMGWVADVKLRSTKENTNISDRFGWDVSMDSDFVSVGAPGHSFGNDIVESSGSFVRKEFNAEFNISERTITDSDNETLGLGAAFTFENKLFLNRPSRDKEWTFSEKLLPQDQSSQQEFLEFGSSVDLVRYSSMNGDYVLSVGAMNYISSGTNILNTLYNNSDNKLLQVIYGDYASGVSDVGSAYTYDGILRYQPPSEVGSGVWIDASVFGQNRDLEEVNIGISKDESQNEGYVVYESGMVYSDQFGQIFIESSGCDPRDFGFILQRPYISRVYGTVVNGEPVEEHLNLFIDPSSPESSGSVNLFVPGPDSTTVYNTLGLETYMANSLSESGFNLTMEADTSTEISSSGLLLHASGLGSVESPTLPMRVRGK